MGIGIFQELFGLLFLEAEWNPPELPASILVGLRNRPQRGRLTQVHLGWEAPKVRHVLDARCTRLLEISAGTSRAGKFPFKDISQAPHMRGYISMSHPKLVLFFFVFSTVCVQVKIFLKKVGCRGSNLSSLSCFFSNRRLLFFFSD